MLADTEKQPRIAIVGAGIAGLNAALTLQDAGLASSIYEASNHIGGRMHSDATTWANGMVTELCGEFIDSDHKTIHSLVHRFGLSKINLEKGRARGAQNIIFFFNRYYSPGEIYKNFESINPILQQQIQESGFPTTCTHYTDTGYRLDHMSVYDWIERYVQSGHNSPLGRLLDSACSGFFGLPTKEQSSLNLLYMFGLPDDIPGSSGPLRGSIRIQGGNQQLPLAIARSLPQGCIQLNHRLVSIRRESDASVTLSFMTPNGISEVPYDHVILTLPFSTLRELDYSKAGFDTLKQTAIKELGYGTISKLFLQFDTRYWFQPGPWPGNNSGFLITDLDVQVLWDASLGQSGSMGILVDYTSGAIGASYRPPAPYSTTRDAEIIQQYAHHCLERLEQIFPGISPHYTGVAALNYPMSDPFLLGSYSCWRVGQYTLFAGYERVRQGPIHFAGEHCSIEAQGYMEGAAREGARAAKEIIQGDLGLL
jgi:monoamine oxidase